MSEYRRTVLGSDSDDNTDAIVGPSIPRTGVEVLLSKIKIASDFQQACANEIGRFEKRLEELRLAHAKAVSELFALVGKVGDYT